MGMNVSLSPQAIHCKWNEEKNKLAKAEQSEKAAPHQLRGFVSLVSLLSCFTRTCRFTAWGATLCRQMDQITSYQTLQLHSEQFRP